MRLSDFKDEKAFEVVADLLDPISKITANPVYTENKPKKALDGARMILKTNPKEIKEVFAILNDKDPKDYHCTAATLLYDIVELFSDRDLLQLFGWQMQTPASSTSASGSTEAQDS